LKHLHKARGSPAKNSGISIVYVAWDRLRGSGSAERPQSFGARGVELSPLLWERMTGCALDHG